jgi:predicted ATPase
MLEIARLENFERLKRVSVRLAPITVLVGPNGSGKSSLCQALCLLKQSLGETRLKVDGPHLSLGTFDEIVNVDADPRQISIEVEGETDVAGAKVLGLDGREVKFAYGASFGADALLEHRVRLLVRPPGIITFEDVRPEMRIVAGEPPAIKRTTELQGRWSRGGRMEARPEKIAVDTQGQVSLSADGAVGSALAVVGGSIRPGYEERYGEIKDACKELTRVPWATIDKIYFVPGLRGIDRPMLGLQEQPTNEFATKEGPSQQASMLASTLGYRPEIADIVSGWTEQLVKTKVRQRLMPFRMTSVEALSQRVAGNIVNEGLGLNQLLFPFAQVAITPLDSTIMIEEPELHLHPRAQSQLVDIFLEITKLQRKQIILTTHSEHILFRLLTAVARKDLKVEDLAVHYFEKRPEDVASEIKELKIDEKGRLEGGLPGFFEEDLKEFREYLDALAR